MNRAPTKNRRALGRGLDALIPAPSAGGKRDYFLCPIEQVVARRDQPRRHFDQEALEELAQSIRQQGIIQPLVVRRVEEGFEIIAGERRWRAAQRAQLHQVPVVVQDVSPAQAFEMALVENLQREDLNPLERAEAYQRLVDEHGLKQEELAKRVGKGRSTIANSLRLLALPQKVQHLVTTGELSEGHARTLLGAPDETALSALATRVVKQGLSVRQTERLVRALAAAPREKVSAPAETPQIKHLETRLRQRLGCQVKLKDRDGKGNSGTLELRYTSSDELEKLLDILLG
jgi:ParB family transcriptional regulator, chromosome partitioning protein